MVKITSLINYYIKKENKKPYNFIERVGINCLLLFTLFINHIIYKDITTALLNDLMIILLVMLSFIDIKLMIIPDCINLAILIVSFLNLIFKFNQFYYDWIDLLLNVIFCLFFFIVIFLFYYTKKLEIFGLGDLKLLFSIGLYIGFYKNTMVIFIASIICLLVFLMFSQFRRKFIPFGPFLSLGITMILFFQEIFNFSLV